MVIVEGLFRTRGLFNWLFLLVCLGFNAMLFVWLGVILTDDWLR